METEATITKQDSEAKFQVFVALHDLQRNIVRVPQIPFTASLRSLMYNGKLSVTTCFSMLKYNSKLSVTTCFCMLK